MQELIFLLVYSQLQPEIRDRLNEVNPRLSHGRRGQKQHQFFSADSVDQVVKRQMEIARGILLVSQSWLEIQENARRRFDGIAQMKLFRF